MSNHDLIRKDFLRQAVACEYLGSPFTVRICRLLAEGLTEKTRFGKHILNWQGKPDSDALPLRAAGAFHALKRQGDAGLFAVYPPNEADNETLWRALEAAMAGHDDFLTRFLDSAPQTNEVSRSSAILGLALHVAKRVGLPLDVYEIGASGGLNLGFDAYAYELGDARWGDTASPVKIVSEWQGAAPPLDTALHVVSRRGSDINPLDASDKGQRERLLSYIWPDQTARLARIEAALEATARGGTRIEKADAADWVEREFAVPGVKGRARVLMHTIMWQYLPNGIQARIEAAMEKAGERATKEAPIAWAWVEQDEKENVSAGVRLRLWPDGTDEELGRADFHGRWVRWG
ncbi:MAG: DUF2332 family protein [Parvibaculum sp.]|uniref:DUF2332 domain-containing protein n=1 Tax=Parvibaculum sp. TaxID=2024848 RepID=UPI002AB80E06|nr:DUF2332 family protein [Parvibaculum sp.]MDZ4380413.1 DUF2332 family protein [Parvibaculum sp.]